MERDYTKIAPEDAPWLTSVSARAVCDAIAAGGHQIFYVGGCVRNALLGVPVSDLDMATSATPQQVIELASDAGLKPVPTGIDHGTITVVSGGVGGGVCLPAGCRGSAGGPSPPAASLGLDRAGRERG